MKTLHLFLVLPLALAAGGCGRKDQDGVTGDAATVARAAPGRPGAEPAATLSSDAIVAGAEGNATADTVSIVAAPGSPAGSQPQPQAPAHETMLMRTGTASVGVPEDSLEAAMEKVTALAGRVGGYVTNSSMQSGREQTREASLELKIPSERWNQALKGLNPIGRVESVNVQAQDVGEEFVDVQARMANARHLEERLLQLLANRTGKLEEVVQVEHELASVRESIERYQGRLRYLTARVAMSTLTVQIHEPRPVVGEYPGASVIGDAFVRAWRNFVGFTAGFISALGFLVPLCLLLALAGWILRLLLRRRPAAPARTPIAPRTRAAARAGPVEVPEPVDTPRVEE
ncbi:MAG: hypothetical protein JWM27_743 [Gemmatimonadetes bacterium]|nr:hypothetical protein [Gemmatimonadota bacterium]